MESEEISDRNQGPLPMLELTVDVADAQRKSNLALVGKIITEKLIKKKTIQMIIRRIWFTNDFVRVEQLCNSTFLFSFKKEGNQAKVWNRRPWMINDTHLLLKEWSPQINLKDLDVKISTL